MFERFTRDARATVGRGQQIARDLQAPQIGSEHLLLALLDDEAGIGGHTLRAVVEDLQKLRDEVQRLNQPAKGLLTEQDADALRSVGIDLDAVLRRIEESFGPDALAPAAGRLRGRRRNSSSRFGPDAKKSIELSLREALRLHHREINSGHLLLGLTRDNSSGANRALVAAGVSPIDLRAAVETALRRAA